MIDFDCIPQVDLEFMNAEHCKAFDDANQIKGLLESAKTDLKSVEKKIDLRLKKLLADTVNHFQMEEKYMQEYQFPARIKHQQEHQRVLAWMADEYSHWQSQPSVEAVVRLEQYVSEAFPQWLVNHIVTMDTVTASYIARNGGSAL